MIVFIFYILFSSINSDNYYVIINTINFSINIPKITDIIEDFNKLFPSTKILIDNENKGYYKLGSSTNQFSNFTNSTLKKGDLVLLEDNSYAFFYNPPSITINHIYIGYIVGYNLLLSNTNTVYSYWFIDNQMNINNSSCINETVINGIKREAARMLICHGSREGMEEGFFEVRPQDRAIGTEVIHCNIAEMPHRGIPIVKFSEAGHPQGILAGSNSGIARAAFWDTV